MAQVNLNIILGFFSKPIEEYSDRYDFELAQIPSQIEFETAQEELTANGFTLTRETNTSTSVVVTKKIEQNFQTLQLNKYPHALQEKKQHR